MYSVRLHTLVVAPEIIGFEEQEKPSAPLFADGGLLLRGHSPRQQHSIGLDWDSSLITPPVHKWHGCHDHCPEMAQFHGHSRGHWLTKIRCRPPLDNVVVTFKALVRPSGTPFAISLATSPSRARTLVQGNPLDTHTQVGAQASREQFDKILIYMESGRGEGAKMLIGGGAAKVSGLEGSFYIQPTIFHGQNKMRVFQEEIFGPALGVTTFKGAASRLAGSGSTATTPT